MSSSVSSPCWLRLGSLASVPEEAQTAAKDREGLMGSLTPVESLTAGAISFAADRCPKSLSLSGTDLTAQLSSTTIHTGSFTP